MPDSRRLDETQSTEADDRGGRAEALLVEGLDRYFAGQYEDAIHVWTRVLFLDRSHARARAYIDRARTAIAERQRRAEEMLHATSELLAEGQTGRARALLAQAEAASGDDPQASALRARLERMERAGVESGPRAAPAIADAIPLDPRRKWPASRVVLVGGCVAATLVAGAAIRPLLDLAAPTQPLAVGVRPSAAPVLSSADVALVRARTLYARGRLAEALRALSRVDIDSANRSEADRLRVEIQQTLLATRRNQPPVAGAAGRGAR
jgi:tetratricopeptide (TPR) repeat protein